MNCKQCFHNLHLLHRQRLRMAYGKIHLTNAKRHNSRIATNDSFFNPCKIQMISDDLHRQLFPDKIRVREYEEELITKCKRHLSSHNLWDQEVEPLPPISFQLPPLQGSSINDHFINIATKQVKEYKALLDDLVASPIPPKPKSWVFKEGWTKYSKDGSVKQVSFPDEGGIVFDIEVCLSSGHAPVMATGVSTTSWYSWCSKALIEGRNRDPKEQLTLSDLIPFESDEYKKEGIQKEKIIVGHNVSYDRARIREEYLLEGSKIRFMDTMSLHIAISGITSFQRALKMTMKGKEVQKSAFNSLMTSLDWNEVSSLNNLKDVYKLYCDGELEKESRDIFVKGDIPTIKENFQNLIQYCSNDVVATHSILVKLLSKFYRRFPHPVTLSGMLEMGSSFLPINSNWPAYIEKSISAFDEYEKELKGILMHKANEALELLENEKYKEDPWLWDLDWTVKKVTKRNLDQQGLPTWYRKLLCKKGEEDYVPGPGKISTSMQIVPKLLRLSWMGFPLHYTKKGGWGFLIKNASAEENPITSEEIENENSEIEEGDDHSIPEFPYSQWEEIWEKSKVKILEKIRAEKNENAKKMTKNFRFVQKEMKDQQEKVAESEEIADFLRGLDAIETAGLRKKPTTKKKRVKSESKFPSPHPKVEFIPLPHKDGDDLRVGNPLAKDFLNKIEDGILSSLYLTNEEEDIATKVVKLSKMVSYWRNNRERIGGQVVVWTNDEQTQGGILPQVSVAGTLTRRAVEPTWLTASNAYEDRVGSELKGMIQSPPGFHFVGSDVDSQELWIASAIGDASFTGIPGSTPIGWMTLQGNKGQGTDMHSKTAALIGIQREQAKVLNYGRIYGAGVTFAQRLLRQFNRSLSSEEAKNKAKAMYKMTKGEKKYLLNERGATLGDSIKSSKKWNQPVKREDLYALRQCVDFEHYESPLELVKKSVWADGTESEMFNRLEEIAQHESPQTPILGCIISRSLVPSVVRDDFMTSRVNWVVQSSAVDYLHLMLTAMRWLIDEYKIQARFSISVHDEVRYLVRSEDKYRAALALQITNLFTRAMCSYRLNMMDLPQAIAFFSLVDIDKVLRKEVHQECKTPSNPKGLQEGYGIPPGEALDINQILKIIKSL